jgi:hypothetical protein
MDKKVEKLNVFVYPFMYEIMRMILHPNMFSTNICGMEKQNFGGYPLFLSLRMVFHTDEKKKIRTVEKLGVPEFEP